MVYIKVKGVIWTLPSPRGTKGVVHGARAPQKMLHLQNQVDISLGNGNNRWLDNYAPSVFPPQKIRPIAKPT
jgi:hypothetical protein